MHPTSSAQKENILSLASHGHSTCTIASRLGLSQSTVSRTLRTLHPNQPCSSGGCPPSFPLEINMLFYHKLLLAELPMLLRSPNTSIQLSPTQSPQKQSEEFSGNIHSRLW